MIVRIAKGMKLIHLPTSRPVRVVRVDGDAFEVVTLDDELGCRWSFGKPIRF